MRAFIDAGLVELSDAIEAMAGDVNAALAQGSGDSNALIIKGGTRVTKNVKRRMLKAAEELEGLKYQLDENVAPDAGWSDKSQFNVFSKLICAGGSLLCTCCDLQLTTAGCPGIGSCEVLAFALEHQDINQLLRRSGKTAFHKKSLCCLKKWASWYNESSDEGRPDWCDLNQAQLQAALQCGYTETTWNNGGADIDEKSWAELDQQQQAALELLGYDESDWDDSDSD